jgi:hypothetical protein
MSTTSEAVKILIAADDQASAKFGQVGDAADKFKSRLHGLNQIFSGGGMSKYAGELLKLTGKLSVGKIAVEALMPVFDGAALAIRDKFSVQIAEANSELRKLTDNLHGVGHAATAAFSDSHIGTYFKKWLDTATGGVGNIGNMVLRDAAQSIQDASGTAPSGVANRNFDPHEIGRTLPVVQRRKLLSAQSAAFVTEERRLLDLGARTTNEERELKLLRRNMAQLRTFRQGMGFDKPTTGELKQGIFGGGFEGKPGVLSGMNASAASDILRQMHEGRFTNQIGGRPQDILRGLANEARKKMNEDLAKQLDLERRRADIFESTRTPQEAFNAKLKELNELFPNGGEVLDRAKAALKARFGNALNGNQPAAGNLLQRLGDNDAVLNRFGGGVVKNGPEQEILKVNHAQLRVLNKIAAKDEKQQKREAFQSRRLRGSSIVPGTLNGGNFF